MIATKKYNWGNASILVFGSSILFCYGLFFVGFAHFSRFLIQIPKVYIVVGRDFCPFFKAKSIFLYVNEVPSNVQSLYVFF